MTDSGGCNPASVPMRRRLTRFLSLPRLLQRGRARTLAAAAIGIAAGAGLGACAAEPPPENVRHRLFVSNYKPEESGKCYIVLRYDELWRDARHSRRVGLIKFRTSPEPTLIDHRWVWGKPVGGDEFILFDAKRNRTVRRTDYIERKATGGDGTLIAFANASGRVEVVRPDGSVVVPEEAGFTDVQLARGTSQRLELRIGRDGPWETLLPDAARTGSEQAPFDGLAGTETAPVGGS